MSHIDDLIAFRARLAFCETIKPIVVDCVLAVRIIQFFVSGRCLVAKFTESSVQSCFRTRPIFGEALSSILLDLQYFVSRCWTSG